MLIFLMLAVAKFLRTEKQNKNNYFLIITFFNTYLSLTNLTLSYNYGSKRDWR